MMKAYGRLAMRCRCYCRARNGVHPATLGSGAQGSGLDVCKRGTEMAETETRTSIADGVSLVLSAWRNPVARILNVDLLAVLLAILLPWSTTGVVIVAVLWVIALAFALELRGFLQSLARPISALPIALFALALVGTLWSDAAW